MIGAAIFATYVVQALGVAGILAGLVMLVLASPAAHDPGAAAGATTAADAAAHPHPGSLAVLACGLIIWVPGVIRSAVLRGAATPRVVTPRPARPRPARTRVTQGPRR